jgi:hypothetical protein
MSGRIIRGVSNAHTAACQSRARRELAQIQREDTRRFTEITSALRNAEHIPPERIADYLNQFQPPAKGVTTMARKSPIIRDSVTITTG